MCDVLCGSALRLQQSALSTEWGLFLKWVVFKKDAFPVGEYGWGTMTVNSCMKANNGWCTGQGTADEQELFKYVSVVALHTQ